MGLPSLWFLISVRSLDQEIAYLSLFFGNFIFFDNFISAISCGHFATLCSCLPSSLQSSSVFFTILNRRIDSYVFIAVTGWCSGSGPSVTI
ncbi:MAG: hypothetical protein LBC02_06690 [Planctomycetaceae bacterium]|nr:hypothetical protein [Planctomycetaceae bacterium]